MEKIKVLQVNKLYAPHIGGVEKVVQDIAEGLKDKVDMRVLVCQTNGGTKVEHINDVEVTRSGSLGIYFSMPLSFSFFAHLRKLSRDRDILHFHMPFPLADAAFLLSGYKGKVVIWWHSDIVRQKSLMRFYKPIMDRFLKRADRIIAATEGHINGSQYLQPYREKCVIIPFGIDMKQAAVHKAPGQADAPHMIDTPSATAKRQVKKVLFIGRLIYYKGVNVLLDAFSRVHGAQLLIAGEGPLKPKLEKQAADLGIAGNVLFLGHVDDNVINQLLNECDMLVLPSIANSEAFGIVQIEAMAHSKPVINTSLPTGVPYVSIHGQTGLTVPPGDAFELASAIQRLVDNDNERLLFGKNAKTRAVERYRLENMLDSVFRLYEDVLK